MTKTAMNVAIATALGWKNFFYDEVLKVQFGLGPENITLTNIPNYTEDLNACFEMENTLKADEIEPYRNRLRSMTIGGDYVSHLDRCWHATSAQRCEAFLKIKYLWQEAKPTVEKE